MGWLQDIPDGSDLSLKITTSENETHVIYSDTVNSPGGGQVEFGIKLDGKTNEYGFKMYVDNELVDYAWDASGNSNTYFVNKDSFEVRWEITVESFIEQEDLDIRFGPIKKTSPYLLLSETFKNNQFNEVCSGGLKKLEYLQNEAFVFFFDFKGNEEIYEELRYPIPPTPASALVLYTRIVDATNYMQLSFFSTEGEEIYFRAYDLMVNFGDENGVISERLTDLESYGLGTLGALINAFAINYHVMPY